ncbi:MAG: ribonuclease P protein component [Planctomycetota bacterium]|nr:ribonuclease P protein component [Planctomycetota bacterium]
MISRRRFPRLLRIRSGSSFARIYRDGMRARGEAMIVVGAPNGLGHPRLGLSVGKRIWKSAVKRNRVRRVFREAFRLSAAELPHLDLVMIPAVPKLRPETPAVCAELLRLAHRVEAKLDRMERERSADSELPARPGRRTH